MDDVPAAMHCARCRRVLSTRTFQFETSDGLVLKCPGCAVRHWPMLRRSVIIASVVGSILTAINHGDELLSGAWTSAWLWKVPLTYSVPFSVATLSALINGRTRSRRSAAG